jgi:signal transduction histidine kinase
LVAGFARRGFFRRPVAQFALAGIAVLTVFAIAAVLALRSLADAEAVRDARQFAALAGQGIVEPAIDPALLDGDPAALEAVDRVVNERVLGERVVRVKLWDATGRIVYSDEPRLIGSRYPLDASKREILRTGATRSELSDLDGPENRFEQGQGRLYEVYLPVRAPDGTPLVFETYQRRSAVAATGRRIWLPFAALVLGSLVLLWLVQAPLAWRLGRRLRKTQEERAALLQRAVDASADERRRIAADLHDGPVQDLAGISYSLSAAAEADAAPATRATLRQAASGTRDAMRRLRTLLVELHPPNLRASGLEAALDDLLAPLRAQGLDTRLAVTPDVDLTETDERLVYRGAAEALRNVERHARATRVDVTVVASDGTVRLEIVDDGVGFSAATRDRSREDGHMGLTLLEELAAQEGASVSVHSAPGDGTRFALEVPPR